MAAATAPSGVRLDKWCWAARLFRTRSLAAAAIDGGRVRVNDGVAKPARAVRLGDRIAIVRAEERLELVVCTIDDARRAAARAQLMYQETEASRTRRLASAEQRRLAPEPAAARKGRPDKREARALRALREG